VALPSTPRAWSGMTFRDMLVGSVCHDCAVLWEVVNSVAPVGGSMLTPLTS
jgi:hypothetical protein